MHAHIPLLDLGPNKLAILFSAQVDAQGKTGHIALCLKPCTTPSNILSRSLYCVGIHPGHGLPVRRTVIVGGDMETLQFHCGKARWGDIHIAYHPEWSPTARDNLISRFDYRLLQRELHSPFHFLPARMSLLDQGYTLESSQDISRSVKWHHASTELTFRKPDNQLCDVVLCIGRCPRKSVRVKTKPSYWATLHFVTHTQPAKSAPSPLPRKHDCSRHHISSWHRQTKTFQARIPLGLYEHAIVSTTLSFTPFPSALVSENVTSLHIPSVVNISKISVDMDMYYITDDASDYHVEL